MQPLSGLLALGVWMVLATGQAWADMGVVFPTLNVRAGSKAMEANNQGVEQYNQGNWESAKIP